MKFFAHRVESGYVSPFEGLGLSNLSNRFRLYHDNLVIMVRISCCVLWLIGESFTLDRLVAKRTAVPSTPNGDGSIPFIAFCLLSKMIVPANIFLRASSMWSLRYSKSLTRLTFFIPNLSSQISPLERFHQRLDDFQGLI